MGTNKIRDVLLSGYSNLSVVMATARSGCLFRYWNVKRKIRLYKDEKSYVDLGYCYREVLLNVHDLPVI